MRRFSRTASGGLVLEQRLVQPALHADRAAMHPADGPAALQLVQVPPHGRGRDLEPAAEVLDAVDAVVADQGAQVVPALRRQRFLVQFPVDEF